MEVIDRCKVINFNKIIVLDCRDFVLDLDLNDYFNVNALNIDSIDTSQLNLRKASHEKKFIKSIQKYIELTNLQETIDRYCMSTSEDRLE